MSAWLEWWGGVFYLLSKILLSSAESSKREKLCRLYGWLSNLIGVPAWVILLILQKNWMATAVEAGCIPALILGVFRSGEKSGKQGLSDKAVTAISYLVLAVGVCFSLKVNHGIATFSQVLEIGEMAGLLIGSYLLAEKRQSGWLWFMLMNCSMGTLQALAGRPVLVAQQAASLFFCIFGYIRAKRSRNNA